jgi:ParB/RepB/Spo0J family partition protein
MIEILISKLHGHEKAKPRKALVQSIQDQGFLPAFPIVVTQIGNGVYNILDGRRRTAAALQAGLKTVPSVVAEGDAAFTILAHATRSENLVAELQAYQELQRAGMSEEQIARAGYATLQRIRKIAKLNRLIPEIATRVEKGEIAPGVAFQITKMAPEIQHELVQEENITGPVVREYRYAQRQEAKLSVPGLEQVFETPSQATIEDLLVVLSGDTLNAILAEMPADDRFTIWRAKIRKTLAARLNITRDLVLHAEQTV